MLARVRRLLRFRCPCSVSSRTCSRKPVTGDGSKYDLVTVQQALALAPQEQRLHVQVCVTTPRLRLLTRSPVASGMGARNEETQDSVLC